MSSTNANLGQYDMVLALSQSKINFEIGMLYKQGIIKPNWHFLTSLDGKILLNSSDTSFADVKKGWLDKDEFQKRRAQLKAELKKIQTQVEDAPVEQKLALRQLRDAKEAEIEALDEQEKATGKYQVLMDATINAPKIELLPDTNTELLFVLPIKAGKLSYLNGQSIEDVALNGMAYAFKVPIGKMQITADAMYMIDEAKKIELREGGLNDNDFTIESMLLNFQNANVSQYSQQYSKLPAEATQLTNLQIAVTNYFKSIANNNNPYVLGYAIQKKKLAEREKAMLYPTGASFSTSASQVKNASAFNFLLLAEGNQFPSGAAAGRIDNSLIEHVKDTTATASGVIGINYNTFVNLYLNQLHASVVDTFDKLFKESFPGFYQSHEVNGNDEIFKFYKPGMWMNFTLKRTPLKDGNDNYIHIGYNITAAGSVHSELPTKIFFDAIETGTVGADQKFSTEGGYEVNGKKGAAGWLMIKLGASDQGKLQIISDYHAPSIGRDTEKPICKNAADAIWLKVSRFMNPFGLIGALVSIFVTEDQDQNIVKFDGDVFKPFKFDALKDFSNKVVLPGSNVYTFLNVRLLNGHLNENDAVLFDITYAVVAN